MTNIEIAKINRLEVGQVIDNYTKLCELLEIKVKTGGSKIKQLEKLEKFISYHKEGNKFIIDGIKEDKAILRDKKSLGNNSKTSAEIGDIILHKIITEYRGNQIVLTSNQLLYKMMLVSDEYKLLRSDLEMYQHFTGIDFRYLNSFMLKVGYQLNRRIESALKRLKNSGYIMYDEKKFLKFKQEDGSEYVDIIDEEIEKQIFIDSKLISFRNLNNIRKKEDKKLIPDMGKIFMYGEFRRFKKLVCEELNKYFEDECTNFWDAYVITTTELAIEIVKDDRKYNTNLEYIKSEFYNLLEKNTKEIKDSELLILEEKFNQAIKEENDNLAFGEVNRIKSYNIKNIIYNIETMNKNLIY